MFPDSVVPAHTAKNKSLTNTETYIYIYIFCMGITRERNLTIWMISLAVVPLSSCRTILLGLLDALRAMPRPHQIHLVVLSAKTSMHSCRKFETTTL